MKARPKEISAETRKLIEKLREYCRSQVAIWQTIPELAVNADGRTGFDDNLSRAYCCKKWALEKTVTSAGYAAYVDLNTGNIVSAMNPKLFAPDDVVLRLLLTPEDLDAGRITKELKREARVPISPYISQADLERMDQERREFMESARRHHVYPPRSPHD